MTHFSTGQRVRVVRASDRVFDPLVGLTGTVVYLRKSDNGAWVRFDIDLPPALVRFADDDEHFRDATVYPEDCEAIV